MAKLKNAARSGSQVVTPAEHTQTRTATSTTTSHASFSTTRNSSSQEPNSDSHPYQPCHTPNESYSFAMTPGGSMNGTSSTMLNADDPETILYHPEVFKGYSPLKLSWNDLHTLNNESIYCYCGQDRYLDIFMLQCKNCNNWYHEGCVHINLGSPVPFTVNYEFTCAACSPSGIEMFSRSQPAWKEVVATVLANLMMNEIRRTHQDMSATALTRESIEPSYFIREDFALFIEAHWVALWGNKEKITKVWRGTLSTTLYQYRDVFITTVDTRITQAPFTLFDQNLFNIRPGYLDMFSKTPGHSRLSARILPTLKTATEQVTSGTAGSASSLQSLQQLESVIPGATSATVFIGATSYSLLRNRGARKERGVALRNASIPPGVEVPFNRDGYKYALAEINPYLRYTVYRECNMVSWRGGHAALSMSREDRSPAIVLSNDATSVTTVGGYRTGRAIFPIQQGSFYFEVFVEKAGGVGGDVHMGEDPYVRIGFAKREASLLGPVGYDDVGFAYQDKTGARVTNSRPIPYGEPYGAGDVIGVLLVIPPWTAIDHALMRQQDYPLPSQTRLAQMRHRTAIRFKTSVYLETKDYTPLRDHPLPPVPISAFPRLPVIPGSKLVFFKNGVCQGTAFQDLPAPVRHVCARINEQMASYDDGSLGYYPTISCYRGGKVTVNFGPHFMYYLPEDWDPIIHGIESLPRQLGRSDGPTSVRKQYPIPQSEFLRINRPWKPYAEAQWDHDTEECLWDMLDEIDHWHALEIQGLDRAMLPHPPPIMLDREDEPTLRPITNLIFPTRNETYADYIASLSSTSNMTNLNFTSSTLLNGSSINAMSQSTTSLTLRELLMPSQPTSSIPIKRARVKWALTEEP